MDDARFLLSLFDATYLLAMTAWIGSILFFSFGVAPIIFKVLDASQAARFVRALFPQYYAWGATSGAIALAAFVCGVLTHPGDYQGLVSGVQIALLLAGTMVMVYGGNVLTPAINAARDAGPPGAERFQRLHRRSVWLNSLVMIVGVGLVIAFAFRPSPHTPGLVEPTPREAARQRAETLRTMQEAYEARLREIAPQTKPAQAPATSP